MNAIDAAISEVNAIRDRHGCLEDDWGGERFTPKLKCVKCAVPYPCPDRKGAEAALTILRSIAWQAIPENLRQALPTPKLGESRDADLSDLIAQWAKAPSNTASAGLPKEPS